MTAYSFSRSRLIRIALICILLLQAAACQKSNPIPVQTAPTVDELSQKNGVFQVTFGEKSLSVALDAPDKGDLSGLKISTVGLEGGKLVLVNDLVGKYLPEIRYFPVDSPDNVRILLRLKEYSPYSLHTEHALNLDGLKKGEKGTTGTLQEVKTLLAPYAQSGVSGLFFAAPEEMNTTSPVNLYETYLPGIFIISPAGMSEFKSIDNVLVITFLTLPDVSFASFIENETQAVSLVNLVGLSSDDLANFQVIADNPDKDPADLTPFGEKTVQERYSEVQTRTIEKIINNVQIIDRPCGSPDLDKKIFAMDPMPGKSIIPMKDSVKLYRCQVVSTEELNVINVDFQGSAEGCAASTRNAGVDVVLVIDSSGSMAGSSIASAKASAIQFISRLDASKDQIGLVSFESKATKLSNLTDNFDKIIGLISGLQGTGGTSIAAGLNTGAQVVQNNNRPGAKPVVVLLSDGFSDPDAAIAAAGSIKAQGVGIISVGVGNADQGLLSRIASTSSDLLFSSTRQGLREVFDSTALRITGSGIAASNVLLRLTLDTEHYSLIDNLLTNQARVASFGVIEWEIPVVYIGQNLKRPLVVRPLSGERPAYGKLEVIYDKCENGPQVIQPVRTIETAEVKTVTNIQEIIQKSTTVTNQLKVFETKEYIVDMGTPGLFSVDVEGAGSTLPPDVLSGNGNEYLVPLYTKTAENRSTSLFFLKDPRLYWFYLQSNGLKDTGEYKMKILDGETAELASLQTGAAAIDDFLPPTETHVFKLPGLAEGETVSIQTKLKDGSYSTYSSIVSLDGKSSYSMYSLRDSKTDTNTEAYKLQGTGPFRLIITSNTAEKDTSYALAVEKGDKLGAVVGSISAGETVNGALKENQVDLWDFKAKKDQGIQLKIAKSGNKKFYLDYQILDPEGISIKNGYLYADDAEQATGKINITKDGTYTIAISPNSEKGEYSLLLEKIELPKKVYTKITNNQTISAPIISGRQDEYIFSGEAGQVTVMSIKSSETGGWLKLVLIGPDQNQVMYTNTYSGKGQLGPVKLPMTGDYIIQVSGDPTGDSTYEFTLGEAQPGNVTNANGEVLPTPTSSPDQQYKNSKILLYEDIGNLSPWISQTLDSMGMKYTLIGKAAIGELMDQLNSGTQWDLLIISAESKNGGVQGEIWDLVTSRVVNDKTALIAEMWNLDRTANGKVSALLKACGVKFLQDLPRAIPLYNLVPDHPVFNQPNKDISLINYSGHWNDQAGDILRLLPGSSATLLAGAYKDQKTDYGLLASCLDGRMILQTFSNHDYHEETIKALWENYITYVLANHYKVSP